MWAEHAAEENIVYAEDIGSTVDRLRDGHVGLVVLVNKYDGIDLPGDACRVLVIDGPPESFSGEEHLETQLTSRTSGFDDRQVQRIEQGMGRGVRSNEDHCVVFLLGARLTQLVNDQDSSADVYIHLATDRLGERLRATEHLVWPHRRAGDQCLGEELPDACPCPLRAG